MEVEGKVHDKLRGDLGGVRILASRVGTLARQGAPGARRRARSRQFVEEVEVDVEMLPR